jgi:hypothetical protein
LKKKTIVIVVLNMQKGSWNIINLHQVLSNETLQVIELKKKKKLIFYYYAPLAIFQRYKITILSNCHTPCDSFHCVCTALLCCNGIDNLPIHCWGLSCLHT